MVISGFALLAPKRISAQCPFGGTLKSVQYTTTLAASGGNIYNTNLPQFNPSPGGYTLLSAVLSATALTQAIVKYTNIDPSNPQDFTPSIFRRDKLFLGGGTVAAPPLAEYDYPETILTTAGSAGDNILYPSTTIFDNALLFSSTINNAGLLTSIYQGAGTIPMQYTSTFFATNFIPTGVNVNTQLTDQIKLSVTYNYCDPTVLASNILSFTASRINSQTVNLNWEIANEQPGRKYYIEVSSGGQDFATVSSQPSTASVGPADYNYAYSISPSATGALYFRIRQVDQDGTMTWSDVRIINLDGNGNQAFSIYPNPPSDYINLTLPGASKDWQVDIISASGALVFRDYYRNSNLVRVSFGRRLSAGTYFVRATSPKTGQQYSGSFLMR